MRKLSEFNAFNFIEITPLPFATQTDRTYSYGWSSCYFDPHIPWELQWLRLMSDVIVEGCKIR